MLHARRTLRDSVTFDGLGLHSGEPVKVTVHPGEAGIWFRLGSNRIEAIPENVTDTTRCTRLGEISTIEHLMSALAGLEISDAEVELSSPELPGMDGSSAPYLQLLEEARSEPTHEQELPELFSRLFIQEDFGLKMAVGKGSGHWRYVYDLGARWPQEQAFECSDVIECYGMDIAPARTLVLTEEIPAVQSMGLGKGLDESSVLIVGLDGYTNAPRFPDEPARHKLLDLIGDLYLSGVPIRALNVVAEKTGHRANVHMAAMLKQAMTAAASQEPASAG